LFSKRTNALFSKLTFALFLKRVFPMAYHTAAAGGACPKLTCALVRVGPTLVNHQPCIVVRASMEHLCVYPSDGAESADAGGTDGGDGVGTAGCVGAGALPCDVCWRSNL
jgi:hypothetical protein